MKKDTFKIGELIKQALEQRGLQTLKPAAKAVGISQELLRRVVKCEHIPKDATLGKIAGNLGLDRNSLILAAHREKVPVEVKGYFLSADKPRTWEKKRVWPLSFEQCVYLGKIMNGEEIQLLRKFRQVPDATRAQILGYVDYAWASNKTTMNESREQEKIGGEQEKTS